MNYSKNDMVYTDYSWTAIKGDDPKISGKPDSTMFNRHEGYEVLYLINALAKEWNLSQKNTGQKMERMIRLKLPTDIRSQENVRNWIKNNWNN